MTRWRVNVPSGIPWTGDEGAYLRSMGLSGYWTSGDTELTWRVDERARALKSGTLTGSPEPLDDAPAEHAATLLRVAEASLVLDCADVPPPAMLMHSEAALSASSLDADNRSLNATAQSASDNWRKVSERQRTCSQAVVPNTSRHASGSVARTPPAFRHTP